MNKRKIVLIGGGGHSKVVISQLQKLDDYEIAGVIDDEKKLGSSVLGIDIIGTDSDLGKIYTKGIHHALITVGSVKENNTRYELFNKVKKIGFSFPVVISPGAFINKGVRIGEGTIVMSGSIINVDSSIGVNCIINTGAIVEHDCIIGNHCHISVGAHISGNVKIGELSFVGAGSTIIQGIQVGKNVTIGAGSVIIDAIQNNAIVWGNRKEGLIKK